MRDQHKRRGRWRLRAVIALTAAALWVAGPWSTPLGAQGPPAGAGDFPGCVEAYLISTPTAGDNRVGGFQDPDTLLAAVWVCAGVHADREIVPIGRAMLGGLVIIMIIWTGVGFMFSGQFDLGGLLGTIFLAGLGFMAIDNYFFASPAATPWLPAGERSQGFVALFADQAVAWGDMIIGSADEDFQRAFSEARTRGRELVAETNRIVLADANGEYAALQGSIRPTAQARGWIARTRFEARMLLIQVFHWTMGVLLGVIGWMIYAQYVWGFFTLAVLTVLGPLFIPFMLISQLDFLFMGWVKGMINGVIYMLTGAALYAVTAMLLVAPLQRMTQAAVFASPTDPGGFLDAAVLMVQLFAEYIPLVVMSLFAALKVNALSSMIVAGGTPVGAGLGSAITKAASGMRTAAGWASAAAAGGVLSQVTDRQRAKQAIDEAKRRAGGSPRLAERGPYRGDPLKQLEEERQRLKGRKK